MSIIWTASGGGGDPVHSNNNGHGNGTDLCLLLCWLEQCGLRTLPSHRECGKQAEIFPGERNESHVQQHERLIRNATLLAGAAWPNDEYAYHIPNPIHNLSTPR